MANKGFIQDPLATINLLRDTLRDRYQSGFPIVKELVQNADDAEAKLLKLTRTNGLAHASHPLLRGPALVIINDGPASDDDLIAIRHMGINYKAEKSASVGKFGLGLKSIFHLCEAFFYIACHRNPGEQSTTKIDADILNPWSGPDDLGSHGDWDEFSEECQKAVIEHMQSHLPGNQWFLLWIPLRQKRQCFDGRQECDPIVGEFFDQGNIASVLPATLVNDLIPLLPFQKSVSRVESTNGCSESSTDHSFSIRLEDDFLRRRFPSPMTPGQEFPIGGKILISDANGECRHCHVSGWELYLDSAELEAVKSHSSWPRSASPRSSEGENGDCFLGIKKLENTL